MPAVEQLREQPVVITGASWEARHVWERICWEVRSRAEGRPRGPWYRPEGPIRPLDGPPAGFAVALYGISHLGREPLDEAADELVALGVIRRTTLEGAARPVEAVEIVEGFENARIESEPLEARG